MKKNIKVTIAILSSIMVHPSLGAQAINLAQKPFSFLQASSSTQEQPQLHQLNVDQDFNQTKHVHFKQTYQGYPVWGTDVIIHYPNRKILSTIKPSMNGIVYQNLSLDLQKTDPFIFDKLRASQALQFVTQLFQAKTGIKSPPSDFKVHLMVYVDDKQKAHWAFQVSFTINDQNKTYKPVYIIDAHHFTVYQQWDDIQTISHVLGGGWGGNLKIGKLIYDGQKNDLPSLNIERDTVKKICYLRNETTSVKDARKNDAIVNFKCNSPLREHGNIYWDGETDAANGAYSPSNDALFTAHIIQRLYQDWYGIPVLSEHDKPMRLSMAVHKKMDNAYWDGKEMVFGDGESLFFPLVSLGIAAHEISHGFTEQHSNLMYFGQSGGLNESFSDMAAQAAEFYVNGKNTWEIGSEIMKSSDKALRYMDEPTRDCEGATPGKDCSISDIKNYYEGIDPHFSSGVFNKAFYLLSTAPGWDVKKAFNVMVQANRYYWTPSSTFVDAACGVVKATNDFHYELKEVMNAFAGVGINASRC